MSPAPYSEPPIAEIDDGHWRNLAACAGEPVDLWFPNRGDNRQNSPLAQAAAICARCEVAAECLAYADTNHINHGTWGGLSPRQRIARRRRTRSAA